MDSIDCKCTKGRPVIYSWAGEPIDRELGETWPRAIARWFAQLAANQEFAAGNLDSRQFNKYKMRTEAYVESRIDRIVQGRLLPGSEVMRVSMARNGSVPMFEFRWFPMQRLLKLRKRELIRQYEAEPPSEGDRVFGLHMHLKTVESEDDRQIKAMQNEQISIAIRFLIQRKREGWPEN